ncbi:MAG: hypothetical protein JKY22_12230 [Flavobacteriaceae bacterium]|nr:hypothetical protein [Flavobacteriaceae bacterium]
MTDFELNINKGIAEYLGYEVSHCGESCNHYFMQDKKGSWKALIDYCNNWNDLMPLVVEYEISLQFRDHSSLDTRAYHKTGVWKANENPQRALAECLLKVLQSK